MKEKRSLRSRAFERALTKSEELLAASLGLGHASQWLAREKRALSAKDVLCLRSDYAHGTPHDERTTIYICIMIMAMLYLPNFYARDGTDAQREKGKGSE